MGFVSPKLRASARGQECTLRLPGICQGGTDTTVLAHLPSEIGLKGMGIKVPDWWAVEACHSCHDALDGRNGDRLVGVDRAYYVLPALQRTWLRWFDLGLLRIAGDSDKPRAKPASSKIMPRPQFFRR